MRNRKLLLELLNGLVFAITLIGGNVLSMLQPKPPILLQITVTVLLAAAYLYLASAKKPPRMHVLQEGSRALAAFFHKWYSSEGDLSVFCNDMDWLVGEPNSGVVDALERKGKRLLLFLRDPTGPVVERLKRSGATVFRIKQSIKSQHRISLLNSDGIKKILVRNTEMESERISFIEADGSSDPYLITLAEDLLDDCCDKQV